MIKRERNRDIYLNQLVDLKDTSLIKVITGIRRCGKSSLIQLFKDNLLDNGVSVDNIIHVDFECNQFDNVTGKLLYEHIKRRISENVDKYYILLDEIQTVESWEKTIASLAAESDIDIYLACSNGSPSKFSPLLEGKVVEIKMYTLSFDEFLKFTKADKKNGKDELFEKYLIWGGFPSITELKKQSRTILTLLPGIYSTFFLKDVVQRNNVKDTIMLENVLKYVAANIGVPISIGSIIESLSTKGRRPSCETVDKYLMMLENSFIIYRQDSCSDEERCSRNKLFKYYIADTGIRNLLTAIKPIDYVYLAENIVYFELLRRGFSVSSGQLYMMEVDFIASKQDVRVYYQIASSKSDIKSINYGLRLLQEIDDDHEKVILTMDKTKVKETSGIRTVNLIDFLLKS